MTPKKIKPTTPSQRQTILFPKPTKNRLIYRKSRSLRHGFQRAHGRNHQGRITVRHRGGGHKRLYRSVLFHRPQLIGEVCQIDYDPNRSAHLALIQTPSGSYHYILAPEGLQKGAAIHSGPEAAFQMGNALPLRQIPIGSLIHNLSLRPHQGGRFVRSAGTSAQLIQKTSKMAQIRLNSGEQRLISLDCYASLGVVSNGSHHKRQLGKAGRSRWLNHRPHVRGVAQNPVDHPHGGGEGKTSGGRPSVTPWGRLTKGPKTRSKSKSNPFILQFRTKP